MTNTTTDQPNDAAVVSFDPTTDPADVALTAAAAAHLSVSLGKQGAQAVRLGVTESGCNGYMYDLSFAAAIEADDNVFEFPVGENATPEQSVRVVVSPADFPLVQGTEIDYVTEGLNSALKFANPNADTHCGCGESFSIAAPDATP